MMNSENLGLQKLREAFKEINLWEYENLRIDSAEITPSPRYLKRMERLIQRQKRSYWKYVNTAAKRVAVFAIAVAITLALSMSISAVRKPVVEFFVNIYEKFVEFFYDEEDIAKAPETIETVYTLGYVPEGYELESLEVEEYATQVVWQNKNEEEITFVQRILGGVSFSNHEQAEFEIISLENMTVAYHYKKELKLFIWNSSEYTYMLYVPEKISNEKCIKIIESIRQKDQ